MHCSIIGLMGRVEIALSWVIINPLCHGTFSAAFRCLGLCVDKGDTCVHLGVGVLPDEGNNMTESQSS